MTSQVATGSKKVMGAILSILLSIGVVASVGLVLHKASADPQAPLVATSTGTVDTPRGKMNAASISIAVYPNSELSGSHGEGGGSHPGYVTWGPSSHLVLPAHSLITLTIKGYDGGEALNHAYFGRVIGTIDGTMEVNGKKVNSLGLEDVQHTFTIHSLPTSSQDPLFVNIPVLKVADEVVTKTEETGNLGEGQYTLTVAKFYTDGPGEYVWNCEFPCGDGTYRKFGAAMSKYGYMSGKVTVK